MASNFTEKNILITGCSRGLGYQLAAQFSMNHWNVYAATRNKKNVKENDSANVTPITLDVTNHLHIKELSVRLLNTPIDVIISNAGIFNEDSFDSITSNDLYRMYETNTVAPLMIVKTLINNIEIGNNKLIIIVTGRMGSFGDYSGPGMYGYRMSKAAANMLVKIMSEDLKFSNIKIIALHPGWIQTDMGGENAKISADVSAKNIFNLVSDTASIESGRFYSHDGKILSW